MTSPQLQVKFWGVRGSVACPQTDKLGYGGNTTCVEMCVPGEERYIFDAGTGIRKLGVELAGILSSGTLPVHLFLSHYHWDHIQGLPFFAPFFHPKCSITVYSSDTIGHPEVPLTAQMSAPYFPIPLEAASSKREYVRLNTQRRRAGSVDVHCFPVNHPQGAAGYRVEFGGSTVVFIPDREPGDPRLDAMVREFTQDADVLIHDSQYTAEEYVTHQGWGHTTPAEAVGVACEGRVKQLVLFHHDPTHDDAQITRMVTETRMLFPRTEAACEGSVLTAGDLVAALNG